MFSEEVLKELLGQVRPTNCAVCGAPLEYTGLGHYLCHECGHEQLDDYGKVREFLDENENAPIGFIEACTGVSKDFIKRLLDDGMVQITGGSKVKLLCNRCGKTITYGRYCPECTMDLANGIKSDYEKKKMMMGKKEMLDEEKRTEGGMHYLGKKKK